MPIARRRKHADTRSSRHPQQKHRKLVPFFLRLFRRLRLAFLRLPRCVVGGQRDLMPLNTTPHAQVHRPSGEHPQIRSLRWMVESLKNRPMNSRIGSLRSTSLISCTRRKASSTLSRLPQIETKTKDLLKGLPMPWPMRRLPSARHCLERLPRSLPAVTRNRQH
jgi:hypothetical protein